jgi:hypothetical protein
VFSDFTTISHFLILSARLVARSKLSDTCKHHSSSIEPFVPFCPHANWPSTTHDTSTSRAQLLLLVQDPDQKSLPGAEFLDSCPASTCSSRLARLLGLLLDRLDLGREKNVSRGGKTKGNRTKSSSIADFSFPHNTHVLAVQHLRRFSVADRNN